MIDHSLELAAPILPEIRWNHAVRFESPGACVAAAIRRHGDSAIDPDVLAAVFAELRHCLAGGPLMRIVRRHGHSAKGGW